MKIFLRCGFILIVVAVLFCGCGKEEKQQESVMQNIVFAVQNGCADFLRTASNQFMSENSGINIRIMELPGESGEVYRILSSALSGEDINLDMFVTEDIWLPEFVSRGYLRTIDDLVSLDKDAYPSQLSETLYYDGKLYAVPIELDSGILYYRRDISDGTFNYKQLAAQNDVPYSVRTPDGEDMLCIVRECAALEGSVVKGLELYKRLYDGSEGETNDSMDDFRSQRIAYTRAWSECNNNSCNRFEQLKSKVRVSVPADENGSIMTARIFGVAVRRNLESEKETIVSEFLNYFLSEQFQLSIARELGTLPIQTKYYDMPVVLDYNEYNESFANYINNLKFRTYRDDYMLCSRDAQEALNDYLTGKTGVEETAKAVEKIMN